MFQNVPRIVPKCLKKSLQIIYFELYPHPEGEEHAYLTYQGKVYCQIQMSKIRCNVRYDCQI